jgi:hypothetical protein
MYEYFFIFRLHNIDFLDDKLIPIHNLVKRNCDIGASWGKYWLIGYFVLDFFLYAGFGFRVSSLANANLENYELTNENVYLDQNALSNER